MAKYIEMESDTILTLEAFIGSKNETNAPDNNAGEKPTETTGNETEE